MSSSRYWHGRPTLPSLRHRALRVQEGVAGHRLREAVRVGEPRRREGAADPLDERDRHLLAPGDDEPDRREVSILDSRDVEDGADHRGRGPQAADARPFDLLDDERGVEGPVDDGGRADRDHRGGDEVERADVVQRPARQTDVGTGEAELDDVGDVLPGQVGVGDHHALRTAGGAGGVHQPVEVIARGGRPLHPSGRRLQIPEPLPPGGARGRHAHADETVLVAVRRLVGELEELTVAHQRARPGVLEDVAHLGARPGAS